MTVGPKKMPYDPANPPAGVRLQLGVVAARLRVTVSEMAEATGISRTAIADLMSNKWPKRADNPALALQLQTLLEKRGATPDELAVLWHAHIVHKQHPTGRGLAASGPDERAPELAPYQHKRAAQPATQEEEPMLLPKQSLSPAARRAFQLFTNPFDGEVISDEAMFIDDDIAYCREMLWQACRNSGFVALVGESGAGKTTLMQDLKVRIDASTEPITVIAPGVLGMETTDNKGKPIKAADILHAIIHTLDSTVAVPHELARRTAKAEALLTASAQAGNSHVLVIEEAHCMPDATMKHLKRLHEMKLGRRPLLGILLLAQPELKTRLAEGLRNGTLREVAQRCEIVELLPLDDALKGYLERRATAAGKRLADLMDDEAVEQVRTRLTFKRGNGAISMCYPLAVNNLVTRALNAAAELGAPKVTKALVAGC